MNILTAFLFCGHKFSHNKFLWNKSSRFWPWIAKISSVILVETISIAKICSGKIIYYFVHNFCSDYFLMWNEIWIKWNYSKEFRSRLSMHAITSGENKSSVGILSQDILPINIRNDLSFDRCIVTVLEIVKTNILYGALYKSYT